MKKRNYDCYIFSPDTQTDNITEEKVEDNIRFSWDVMAGIVDEWVHNIAQV